MIENALSQVWIQRLGWTLLHRGRQPSGRWGRMGDDVVVDGGGWSSDGTCRANACACVTCGKRESDFRIRAAQPVCGTAESGN